MFKYESLTPELLRIVRDKGTEKPFSSDYVKPLQQGTYLCRACGNALFRADSQFNSHCGWPSFDDELPQRVRRQTDADGRRTEILCQNCDAHLGHVFGGEKLTPNNLRHCVNGLAIEFVADKSVLNTEEIIVAAGCFWGVQYYLDRLAGVIKTEVGYIGGDLQNPTYEEVCSKKSGHYEALRVIFDTDKTDLSTVIKYFFEIHDPTQTNGQGPDLGPQYLSAVFYYNEQQQQTVQTIMDTLQSLGYDLSTRLLPIAVFWPAENYHQQYYEHKGSTPYCHRRVIRFK
jgi:peptide methionine sulfoxide reductase msrA/msrB